MKTSVQHCRACHDGRLWVIFLCDLGYRFSKLRLSNENGNLSHGGRFAGVSSTASVGDRSRPVHNFDEGVTYIKILANLLNVDNHTGTSGRNAYRLSMRGRTEIPPVAYYWKWNGDEETRACIDKPRTSKFTCFRYLIITSKSDKIKLKSRNLHALFLRD